MLIVLIKLSSFILGSVLLLVELFKLNYYVKDLVKIKIIYKNLFLEKLFKEKGLDNEEIWEFILYNDGFV